MFTKIPRGKPEISPYGHRRKKNRPGDRACSSLKKRSAHVKAAAVRRKYKRTKLWEAAMRGDEMCMAKERITSRRVRPFRDSGILGGGEGNLMDLGVHIVAQRKREGAKRTEYQREVGLCQLKEGNRSRGKVLFTNQQGSTTPTFQREKKARGLKDPCYSSAGYVSEKVPRERGGRRVCT